MGDSETDPDARDARIDALEMRIAYQDKTIEDLNEAIVAQWKQIDFLTRQIASLTDRVQEAETRAASAGRPEPPPPHY
jgi:SlyX protein